MRGSRSSRRAFAFAFVVVVAGAALAWSPRAFADDADKLFQRGVRGMESGDFASACPALASSYKIDPLPGTLFTIAECERLSGKLAAALRHYKKFLADVSALPPNERRKHREREVVAQRQRDLLAPRVPRLGLSFTSTPPAGTRVTVDGEPVDLDKLGDGLLVEPGDHLIVVEASGGTKRLTVSLAERDQKSVELALPAALPGPGPRADLGQDTVQKPGPPTSSGVPTSVIVFGGVGVAGLVTGGVFGFAALGKKSGVTTGCNAEKVCTADGKSAADAVKTLGAVSDVGFAIGAAGLATAVVLYLTRSSDPPSANQARLTPLVAVTGPHDAWLGVRRSF